MIKQKEIEENKFGLIIRMSLLLLWYAYYFFVIYKLGDKLDISYWYSIPIIVLGLVYVSNWLFNARFNIRFKVIK